MENRDFTYQPKKPQINGFHSESKISNTHSPNSENDYPYDNNRPISTLFELLQRGRVNCPLDAEHVPSELLEAIRKCCNNALFLIHNSTDNLGEVLAIAIQNVDAGMDKERASDMAYLFQMLGDMAASILGFKSNAEYSLQKRGIIEN